MKTVKNKIILIAAIMAAVATSFFLVVKITPLFIVAYLFTVLAIALFCVGNLFLLSNTKSYPWIAALPLAIWRYLILQIVLSSVFVILENAFDYSLSARWLILLHVILLGYFSILLTMQKGGIEIIEKIAETREAEIKTKVSVIRLMQADVESLIKKFPAYTKDLCQVADTMRYSDPMSSPPLAEIENKIEARLAALSETVEKADGSAVKALCNELQQLLVERNLKCKISKVIL